MNCAHTALSLTRVSKVAAVDCNRHEWPNAGLHYGRKNSKLRDPVIIAPGWKPLSISRSLTMDCLIKKMLCL